MRLAFYAPLKPPHDPVPSGDRAMARALIAAFEQMGARVDLASTLRSRDAMGEPSIQEAMQDEATALTPDIIAQGRRANWQAWVTYHSYYKAPDLIGPAIARALAIPYLQIEATRARKRLEGPWAAFARAAEAACDAADVIFYLTEHDREALQEHAPVGQILAQLHPFLPRNDLPALSEGEGLIAVGMMRAAAKLPSYKLIAQTMAMLPETTRLEIAGDGPARAQVEAVMVPLGNRVTFLGALGPHALADAYSRAGALIWPGVNEAFGMTYLEAQAYGLPVIAQDRPGVRDVLYPRAYPAISEGAAGLAALAQSEAPSPQSIRSYIRSNHLLTSATDVLRAGLAQAGVT